MQKFDTLKAIAAPMIMPNIDTDVIMPKQFLKRIDREGLAEGVFHDVRRHDDGSLRDDFILNQPRFLNTKILLAGRNFGCGSSREHAVWGLLQSGIRVVVAPSFAGIFYGNCEKNGLLAIILPELIIKKMAETIKAADCPELLVDLEACKIKLPNEETIDFEIEEGRRRNLLSGLDHIQMTLEYTDVIKKFESQHFKSHSWLSR